jgi:uncharacterized membrane protein (DUF4010 family)
MTGDGHGLGLAGGLAGEALRRYAGQAELYALAVVSGLTDVDAITLSLSRMEAGVATGLGAVIAAGAAWIGSTLW